MSELISYESDLVSWMNQQIGFLKAGQYDQLDMENFLEEIEGVIRTEKRTIVSYFVLLIANLLKWQYQPEPRCRSWLGSIDNARYNIELVLEDSPSLKNYLQLSFEEAWDHGRKLALVEMGLSSEEIIGECPWSVDHAMNHQVEM